MEDAPRREVSKEWRGNVVLMVAIALLVGVATFVMVRERLGETPRTPAHAPAP